MKIRKKTNNFIKKAGEVSRATLYSYRIAFKSAPFEFVVSMLISLLSNFFPIISAFMLKMVVDELEKIYFSESVAAASVLIIGLYLLFEILANVLRSLKLMATDNVGAKVSKSLNLYMMGRMAETPCAFYDDPENRNFMSKINMFKYEVGLCPNYSINLVFGTVSLISALIVFIPMNPLLGILYIATYIPGAVLQYRFKKQNDLLDIANIPSVRKKGYYRTVLTDASYAKDLRLYNSVDYFKDKFYAEWKHIRKDRMKTFENSMHKTFGADLLSSAGFFALLIWAIHAVFYGDITIGTLTMFVSLSRTVTGQFKYITSLFPYYSRILVSHILSFKSFCNDSDTELSGKAVSDFTVPEDLEIEFKNVSFRYPGSDNLVLDHVNFKIDGSEKTVVIGVNGVGKSTMIKLLLRFYDPCEGEILFNGENIKNYSVKQVRKIFGVCFQDITKYALTFRENIAVSDISRRENTDEVEEAAEAAGADDIYSSLAEGIDTNLTRNYDEKGYEPSGGQWQKIAVARAFFRKARMLILDEPSAALDPVAEDYILHQFDRLCNGRGGIIISHRLSAISIADRVLFMDKDDGVLSGTHKELMKNPKYAEMYRAQADNYTRQKEKTEKRGQLL